MRHFLRKLISAALAVAMLSAPLGVYASDALGHDLAVENTILNAGIGLSEGTFWSDSQSDLRHENYVLYLPNEHVTPIVTYGETSRSLTTVPAAAEELEAQGWRVVAGINGDYYDTKNGLPVGSTMVNGALRNLSSDPYYAVGFRADGTAVIGDPKLSIQATVNGGAGFPIFAFNYIRHTEYGIFLYDHNFNDRHTTGTSELGVDVICSVDSGALTIGGQLALRVDEVLPDGLDTAVPEGKFIISANLKAGDGTTAPLLALQPGDQIVLTVNTAASEPGWREVSNLVGAPILLVENGAVCAGLPTGSAPRTAIGQCADGSLIFYTIDGRQSGYSIGATLTAVAMRLVELGCVKAVALDGGGSTTLVATMPNEMNAKVVNMPSGNLRPVSNHVFLVASAAPSGIPAHVYLAPKASKALPGATVPLTAAILDTNFIPMGASILFRSDTGVIADESVVLPDGPGVVTVVAGSGELVASAQIEAVLPESITVRRDGSPVTTLALAPDSSVTLTAEGMLNHLPVAGGNECYTWSYEGDGVTYLDNGTLVTGSDAGAGILTVSVGDKAVSIPVTVSNLPRKLLSDFEASFEPLADSAEDPHLTLTRTTAASHVKLGKAAAKLEYTLDGVNPLTIPVDYPVGFGYDRVELWAFGNGGSASLSIRTDAGTTAATPLSYNGWQHLSIPLPAEARQITGITISGPNAVHGMFLIDQFVLAHSSGADTVAPEVSLTLDPWANYLTGRAFDALDGASLPTLRLTCDGVALGPIFDNRTGSLSAALPARDGLAHQVTLTAGDASGNLARTSVYIPADEGLAPAFPDAEGHWAAGAIEYLKRTGISNGTNTGLYLPDDNITRQEFAAMIYRYLKPTEDFSGVTMPFVDTANISSWALESARAMYALNIIGGSRGEDGQLYYNPKANITRQEAVTMLGRLLEKGYIVPALPYADSAEIPNWSAEHIALLGSLGVFDDYVTDAFRPTAPLTRAEMASMLLRIN